MLAVEVLIFSGLKTVSAFFKILRLGNVSMLGLTIDWGWHDPIDCPFVMINKCRIAVKRRMGTYFDVRSARNIAISNGGHWEVEGSEGNVQDRVRGSAGNLHFV